eukprot:12913434-Prorocentrum_lima.AAC.1
MVTGLDPAGLSMPLPPQMSTPPRMSTPGTGSHVPGHLGFSPAATTPQGSPGKEPIDGIQDKDHHLLDQAHNMMWTH